jgi:hypothetical protein
VPLTGATGVVDGAAGSLPVVVSSPNVWPPSVTPEVELRLGAASVSSDPLDEAPASCSETSCSAPGSSLISVTRSVPSVPCVAHTLTGPLGAVTSSRRAPGGNACANINRP